MPDSHIRDERPERELGEQDDPTLTTRVGRPDGAAEGSKPAETTAAEPPVAPGGIVQQIWRRIKEEQNRPKRVENTRGQNFSRRSTGPSATCAIAGPLWPEPRYLATGQGTSEDRR